MKALTEKIIHYLVLILVTFAAASVMWKLSSKRQQARLHKGLQVRPLPAVAAPKAPVVVEPLQVQMCEITSTYAGKIRSWETYQVGFEVTGRLLQLGENQAGRPLDVGDQVQQGQVLAVLDDRVFRAQKSEAAAQVEQATSDLHRAEQVRETSPSALSESELQSLVTNLALAQAQYEVAVKNLEDATLKSPVTATISERLRKPGESVGPNQVVFELVENDNVLLVLDVPESRIRDLETRLRAVEKNRTATSDNVDPEDRAFLAHVRLEGRDRFGKPWPPLTGEVHRIAEVADPRTGLFEVEVRLSNTDRLLRPGMVATADLVTARIPGYMVPESAVLFRGRSAYLFSVKQEPVDMEMLYWNLGPTHVYRAHRVDLRHWVDQGPYIVVPASEAPLEAVIVRGHFRLADSQLIRIAGSLQPSPDAAVQQTTTTQRIDVAAEPFGKMTNDEIRHDKGRTKAE